MGEKFLRWAATEPSIRLVALIGSRARTENDVHAADEYSDWDFHVGTVDVHRFHDPGWLAELGVKPLAYVYRVGRLSSARKVTAVFAEGEVDWVLLGTDGLQRLDEQLQCPPAARAPESNTALSELSAVLQGGYRILKGANEYAEFYARVATRVPAARLSDVTVGEMAEGFVCDYVSTLRKIQRGELLAARRWVHHQLLETNFRLLHEARLRAGLASVPDGRRLERSGDARVQRLSFETLLTPESLRAATEHAAEAFRSLMRELVGRRWTWPDLSALRLSGE